MPGPIRTIALVSLGCPKNLVDSERMLGLLASDGLSVTPDAAHADAIIINTCGFLDAAREESLGAIRDALAMKERGRCQRVIVAGCLAQRDKMKLLEIEPGIDRLVGVFDREHIVAAVRGQANPRQQHGQWLGKYHGLSRESGSGSGVPGSAIPEPQTRNPEPVFENDRARLRLTPRHYAYLRISEGCGQGCTFCTIPSIRGPLRSKPPRQILDEARELSADGAVEINLIGQDTTSYGTDIDYAPGLAGLLRSLDRELREVRWLRLMYAYPSCFTDEMIDALAQCNRMVKYVDLPLQHINDEVLRRMRRRVTRSQTEMLLEKLRRRVPGIAIRTTFIAGTPGETQAQHDELLSFVKDFGFDMMGVFPYSQERGTAMGRADGQLPDEVKRQRVHELMLAQQEIALAKARAMVGRTVEVLVDQKKGRSFIARGAWQAPEVDSTVRLSAAGLHVGEFAAVRVTDTEGYDLVARPAARQARSLTVLRPAEDASS